MFSQRSQELERIDTGDYTAEEYDRFLADIRKVNRYAGDARALRKTLLDRIASSGSKSLSVLDIGAGSGLLLRNIADFARERQISVRLAGLELNRRAAESIVEESKDYGEISSVRADAISLPFDDNSFDFVISSLFAHHLTDGQLVQALAEMHRVAEKQVILIDLHRHPGAYVAYRLFCSSFRISKLVREDGSLSILRGFKQTELEDFARRAGLTGYKVERCFPFRLVLSSPGNNGK